MTSLIILQGVSSLELTELKKEGTEPQHELALTNLKLNLRDRTGKKTLLCDTSTGRDRPKSSLSHSLDMDLYF